MCAAAMTDAPNWRGDERFQARFGQQRSTHTQPGFFSSGELPILVIRSQFAGDCAHVAVTQGQEQRPASADSSIEGPRSGKDSRQSLFTAMRAHVERVGESSMKYSVRNYLIF